jgi:hypothetical protein
VGVILSRGHPVKAALLLLLVACSVACHGQSTNATPKVAIYFDCQCDDPIASQIATAFRDLLATSPRYSESPTVKSSVYHLEVVSMDPSHGLVGHSTVYSVVLKIGQSFYLTQSVRQCSEEVVNGCVARLLSFVDKSIHPD